MVQRAFLLQRKYQTQSFEFLLMSFFCKTFYVPFFFSKSDFFWCVLFCSIIFSFFFVTFSCANNCSNLGSSMLEIRKKFYWFTLLAHWATGLLLPHWPSCVNWFSFALQANFGLLLHFTLLAYFGLLAHFGLVDHLLVKFCFGLLVQFGLLEDFGLVAHLLVRFCCTNQIWFTG